jgi:hypothetical protein
MPTSGPPLKANTAAPSPLQQAQSGNEITEWIDYFVRAVLTAQTDAETLIHFTLKKPNTLTGGKTS